MLDQSTNYEIMNDEKINSNTSLNNIKNVFITLHMIWQYVVHKLYMCACCSVLVQTFSTCALAYVLI